VSPTGDGELEQIVWSERRGSQRIVLEEATLEPLRRTKPHPTPAWRSALLRPESDFQIPADDRLLRRAGRMQVQLIADQGCRRKPALLYLLRWEHAGRNRDRPVPEPWPAATMLRVYKITVNPLESTSP
jgi:hypothetical protein